MSSNLIFHAVSKRKWKQFNKGGYYNPEGTKHENGIVCVKADQLRKYINDNFEGRRQVLVLVIDKSRVISKILSDTQEDQIRIEEKINMDAVLDKILLKPNKEGIFDISVTEE
ncbi:MAG: hypothetical protein U5K72_10275 [Balneolaceae bacterium]|nr:hypothetical protein [Balneolaceae bacterium]